MIAIWTGLPRQGKTINAVKKILPQLRLGRRVITNTPIWCELETGRKIFADFYDDPEEFKYEVLNAEGTLLFVDEMSLYFTSLRWSKLSLDWNAKFRQAGKMSCDFYGTAQAYADVVSNLRRVTDVWYNCHKYHWLGVNLDFRKEVYDAKIGHNVMRGFHLATPQVIECQRVFPSFYTSKSAKNRYNAIQYAEKMYPSEYRRLYRHYDHTKQITSSAMGRLHVFGQKGNLQKRVIPASSGGTAVTK